jgi:hypothetical protein
MSSSYETAVLAWANEQAARLRADKFNQLDIERSADEVEDGSKDQPPPDEVSQPPPDQPQN